VRHMCPPPLDLLTTSPTRNKVVGLAMWSVCDGGVMADSKFPAGCQGKLVGWNVAEEDTPSIAAMSPKSPVNTLAVTAAPAETGVPGASVTPALRGSCNSSIPALWPATPVGNESMANRQRLNARKPETIDRMICLL